MILLKGKAAGVAFALSIFACGCPNISQRGGPLRQILQNACGNTLFTTHKCAASGADEADVALGSGLMT